MPQASAVVLEWDERRNSLHELNMQVAAVEIDPAPGLHRPAIDCAKHFEVGEHPPAVGPPPLAAGRRAVRCVPAVSVQSVGLILHHSVAELHARRRLEVSQPPRHGQLGPGGQPRYQRQPLQ